MDIVAGGTVFLSVYFSAFELAFRGGGLHVRTTGVSLDLCQPETAPMYARWWLGRHVPVLPPVSTPPERRPAVSPSGHLPMVAG